MLTFHPPLCPDLLGCELGTVGELAWDMRCGGSQKQLESKRGGGGDGYTVGRSLGQLTNTGNPRARANLRKG